MAKRTGHFNVAPRYTPGSPALVPEEMAKRVAKEEKRAYEQVLDGTEGESNQKLAKLEGLRGIVEYREEARGVLNYTDKGRKKSVKVTGWNVTDLVTGEKLFRASNEALQQHGFGSFWALPAWAQQQLGEQPPSLRTRPRFRVEYDGSVTIYREEPIGEPS